MALTDWQTEQPPLATSAVAPTRVGSPTGTPTGSQPLAVRPSPLAAVAPDWPSRWHLLIPAGLRNTAAALGLWQNPTPLIPSDHLTQTLAVLERYGWCKSLDFSPTGRMCIRGAQTFLEHTGHVTPAARNRAVDYMQHSLRMDGIDMPFHAWNDLPERTFPQVKHLITASITAARHYGE
ncbi:hypothetical protein ACFVOR_37160 [Streptomyces sp. NPDC057837]|uniref:DUF6197 family protein n=1 Tax=Streptomyces sp. NPDC057837 TaxID=3346260 RepID=UPI0036750B1B